MPSKTRFKVGDRVTDPALRGNSHVTGTIIKVVGSRPEYYDVEWDDGNVDTQSWGLSGYIRITNGLDRVLDEI